MGMIANYYAVDDFTLNDFKKNLDIDKFYNDDSIDYCDIDKIWNGLHYILTYRDLPEYDTNNMLEYAKDVFVYGEEVMSNQDHYYYIPKENIEKILDEINKIDFGNINFDIELFESNEIYPPIWDEDKDLLFEEIELAFNELKNFYELTKNKYYNIIVVIE